MSDIQKFRTFNELKSVYRANQVQERKESSAEHSWSCLLLADYFLARTALQLDRLKVYELLMYHDVVEIEAGDTPIHLTAERKEKEEKEKEAAKKLQTRLPTPLNDKFLKLFFEFEKQKTVESRFAKAIDALDAVIHQLDNKDKWKNWPKEVLIERKLPSIKEFPTIKITFYEIIDYLEEKNYFNQE